MPDNAPMDPHCRPRDLQADPYGQLRDLQAHRPHPTTGLYAVITADPAELRKELDNAAPAQDPPS